MALQMMQQAAQILQRLKRGGLAQRIGAIRDAAVYAQEHSYFPEAVVILLKFLHQDKIPLLAVEAASALWQFKDPRVIAPLLERARNSSHPPVRAKAIRALGFLEALEAAPLMEALLEDKDARLRREAIFSLKRLHRCQDGGFPKRILRKIKRRRWRLFERSFEVRQEARLFFKTRGGYGI